MRFDNHLRIRQLLVVFFQVLRRFQKQTEGMKVYHLDAELSIPEVYRFMEVLSRERLEKRTGLDLLFQSSDRRGEKQVEQQR